MGRIFLEHIGGIRLFSCASCDTILTNRGELISTRFTGATGRAFLFSKVVNLNYSKVMDRVMLTGRHMVRDVFCKNCEAKLGWMYEFATEDNQRYKEGRVILERALVQECDGLEEHPIILLTMADTYGKGEKNKLEDGITLNPNNQFLNQQPASPKKGPTLSTSTSSFEALDPHDPQLNNLASLMFSSTSDWIAGELDTTVEEYKLLEQMNRVTLTKYSDMTQITENMSRGVVEVNTKYSSLLPYLEQIEQIDSSVARLEQAAYKLDAYSKRLEQKFRTLERRSN